MKPSFHVWIADDLKQRFFGPGPYELLTRVKRTHSVNAASKEMRMAYTKATRLVSHAEEGLGTEILATHIGGARGGGSDLTPEGEDVLARYDAWTKAVGQYVETSFASCFAGLENVPAFGCVIMASGAAHRFGRQKLLAPFEGKPLLLHAIEAAEASAFDCVVSTRWDEVAALAEGHEVSRATPEGPLQSDTMRAGIEALGPRAGYLFLQGDQPLVTSQSLDAIAKAAELHPGHVVRLSWQGQPASPVFFPGTLREALLGLEGDEGGSALFGRVPGLKEGTVLVKAASSLELCDVDTPEALETLEAAVATNKEV